VTKPDASVLSVLLLIGAILLSEALILRDKNQAILHQRDVTPTLNHCKTR
jgi:hypothetical protein